ncbi:MAG: hypothetical protein QM697_09015 [Lachnospiraceae bacterium]
MPVGKGSLTRAAKATEGEETQEVSENFVAAVSVISGSDDIHEKKFEAISKIKCDLPMYLL